MIMDLSFSCHQSLNMVKKWFLVMITTTECIMIKTESIKQIVKEHLFMMTPIN